MSAELTLQRGPLPVVVIQQAIMQQVPTNTATDVSHHTTVPPMPALLALRVEVETRQGYVYEGKLLSLDDDYNISLVEATLWRDRLCDVERALLAAKGFPAPTASPATRRRYLGSVFIRSSNLLMVRFLQNENSITNGNGVKSNGAVGLKSAFKSMAVKVKQQINLERQKNRVERRKRLRLTTKQTPLVASKTEIGVRDRDERKSTSKRTSKKEVRP